MRPKHTNGRMLWIGYCLLLALVTLMGLRSEGTIASVLSAQKLKASGTEVSPGQTSIDPAPLMRRDEMLAEAKAGQRDPFNPPPRAEQPVVRRPPRDRVAPAPDRLFLRGIMYDEQDPRVQLAIGPNTSGWLREGDVYRGWTIVRISRTSVRVGQGERLFEISAE
jgi:hypothetical protein